MIPMLRGFGGVGGLGRLADLVRDALGRLPDEPEQRAVGLVVGEHSQGGDDECLVEEHRFHDVALDIGVTELFDLGIAPRPDCDERGTEGLASRQQRLLQRGQNDGVVSENGIGFEHSSPSFWWREGMAAVRAPRSLTADRRYGCGFGGCQGMVVTNNRLWKGCAKTVTARMVSMSLSASAALPRRSAPTIRPLPANGWWPVAM
ncbi:hypothetical protein CPZ06_10160 [Lactobacillus acidophilus]|nr:hypothetical protein CPZ06_10160 [Lactobacillus acidophilus]